MSTSDDVFAVPDQPSYIRRRPQQNGDIFSSSKDSTRAGMENIRSVHENPFYKNYGIKHNAPSHSRTSYRSESRLSSNGRLSSVDNDDDDDDIGEYRPGSGFVHKLLDRFSSLTAREEPLLPLKRSSSLEELKVDNESTKLKPSVTVRDKKNSTIEKPTYLSASKLSQSQRAQSIESLNHVYRKPHHQHNLVVPLRHVEPRWDKDKSSTALKSPRDSHVEAPDVDLAREDIIIIETTPSLPIPKDSSFDDSENDDGGPQVLSGREPFPKDEMPKPNTVLSVRSIFENVSSASSSGSGFSSRKLKTDLSISPLPSSPSAALSPSQTEATQVSSFTSSLDSNRISIRSPSPITSPRILSHDTHAKPVLLPSSVTVSKSDYPRRTSESSSHSNVSSNSVTSFQRPLISSKESTLRSDDNSYQSSDTNSVLGDKKSSLFDSSRSSDGSRPMPSPRTTASVKPTIPSKPSAPVKPVPLSAPASAATSYRRSSPVVPVAPYKDKLEDTKDDGQPVMIFAKSKLSPRREKPQRTKDYTPLNSSQKKNVSDEVGIEKDIIIPREAKKIFEGDSNETNNKVISQKKKHFTPSNKAADKSTPELNKIVHTKQHTTIEIRNSAAKPSVEKVEKRKEADKDLKLPRPSTSVTPKIRSPAPTPPEPASQIKPQSMLYLSNSESSESDATPPETPRTKSGDAAPSRSSSSINENIQPDTPRGKSSANQPMFKNPPIQNMETLSDKSKVNREKSESEDQPIKGIPSIIAQRLKKQSNDPSQVADDVVSASDSVDNALKIKPLNDQSSTDNTIASPRIHLTPVASTASSLPTDNKTKDGLSSEIENEIMAVRKRMEGNRQKSSGATPIFDSSQLAKKRKMNQQQRAAGSQGPVPRLDLTSITDERSSEYQPKPKEIKPCNIVFIGENAKTSRSLLTKKRKVKVNIHFNDAKTETFEYESEDWALEKYLADHPHEKDNIMVLEDFGTAGSGESSDDVETVDVFEIPSTPRGNSDEDLLKSNTALSHSGSLQSYRGRFQEEYEFGAVLKEPEQPKAPPAEPVADPESLMLRPAEEDATNTWSTSSSSDLLF